MDANFERGDAALMRDAVPFRELPQDRPSVSLQ